jgi:hypothetical protein
VPPVSWIQRICGTGSAGGLADSLIDVIKDVLALAEAAAKSKRIWDRTSFLAEALRTGGTLEAKLAAIIEWASEKFLLRWGKGPTYGTAMISPKGRDNRALNRH